MDQNSKIPLTNLFLLQTIMHKKEGQAPLELITPSQRDDPIPSKVIQLKSEVTTIDQPFKTINTSLNYSMEGLQESQYKQSRHLISEDSLHIEAENDQTQLLKELLQFDELQKKGQKGVEKEGNEVVAENEEMQGSNNEDYSTELLTLKAKIVEIQVVAQQEIKRLKLQLTREREKNLSKVESIDIGVNTIADPREEELKILQDSLQRQMTLNKQLLNKSIAPYNRPPPKENIQNHINKVVI